MSSDFSQQVYKHTYKLELLFWLCYKVSLEYSNHF